MEDNIKESPTLEAKPVEPKKPSRSEDEINALLATLDKVNIKSPQHLEGVVQNAREFGNLSNVLGAEREERRRLEQKMAELEAKTYQKPAQSYDIGAAEGNAVDLEKYIAKAVGSALDTREQKQRELQQRHLQTWNRIQSDRNYENVRPVWEEKLKDPNFVYKVSYGMADPMEEYHQTVIDFYAGLAKQSKEVIEQYKGTAPKPPHVETGERSSPNLVSEGPGKEHEVVKRFKQLKEKAAKGGNLTTEEELELAGIATYGLFPSCPRK